VIIVGTPASSLGERVVEPTSESAGGLGSKGPNGKDSGVTGKYDMEADPLRPLRFCTWHRSAGIARKAAAAAEKMSRPAKMSRLAHAATVSSHPRWGQPGAPFLVQAHCLPAKILPIDYALLTERIRNDSQD
jgi:hypothetical protein